MYSWLTTLRMTWCDKTILALTQTEMKDDSSDELLTKCNHENG